MTHIYVNKQAQQGQPCISIKPLPQNPCALRAKVTTGAPKAALATRTLPTASDRSENSSGRASLQHGAHTLLLYLCQHTQSRTGVEIGAFSPSHLPTSLPPPRNSTRTRWRGAPCSPRACPQSIGSLLGPSQ